MTDNTEIYENMQKLVDSYRYFVNAHSALKTRAAKLDNETRIEDLISQAAANGMSKEELDELAEVEW